MTVAWLEQTAAEVPPSDSWLSAGERERLSRFKVEKRRADWLLGRWTAKVAAARSLEIPDLASIEIRPERSGAPRVFVAGGPAAISISISHSAAVAMCAVAGHGACLGCDIETVESRNDSFAADYFTSAELRAFSSVPAARRSTLISIYWSAKESALKALGIGLGIDMRRLAVECEDGGAWNPLTVFYAHLRTLHGWWRESGGLVRTVVAVPAPSPPVPII